MSENMKCHNCGTDCLIDDNFCAHCGQKLKLSSDEVVDKLYAYISQLTPMHLVVLGFLLLAVLGSLTEYLLVSKLSFGFSVFLLVVVISGGLVYLGYKTHSMTSLREYLLRMLIVFAFMGASLLIILVFDRVLLFLFANGPEMVVYRMPGVYVASSAGTRRVTIENAPPYWLVVMVYGIILTVFGNIAHRTREVVLKIT
ncbi:MAG: zinc ribbon domain-containing protein [Anaerolineales bacterium]|jgi:hypothetical protein